MVPLLRLLEIHWIFHLFFFFGWPSRRNKLFLTQLLLFPLLYAAFFSLASRHIFFFFPISSQPDIVKMCFIWWDFFPFTTILLTDFSLSQSTYSLWTPTNLSPAHKPPNKKQPSRYGVFPPWIYPRFVLLFPMAHTFSRNPPRFPESYRLPYFVFSLAWSNISSSPTNLSFFIAWSLIAISPHPRQNRRS